MKREDLKRIVERQIKKLYAESLLLEDMEKRNAVYNYMKKVLDPKHKWGKKRAEAQSVGSPTTGRMQGRMLKKVFAQLADRSFIDSLVTIHWGRDWASIEHALKTVSSKDELSCAAYLPQDVQPGAFGEVGLLVKGHITLVANSMDRLWSGEGGRTGEDFPQMKKTSGINKGVQRSFQASDFYKEAFLVFDKEDWKPDTNPSGRYRNEALVDNWKALAVVFETVDELEKPENQELIEMAEERDMGVLTLGDLNDTEYDFVKKDWYPEEEDEEEEEKEIEKMVENRVNRFLAEKFDKSKFPFPDVATSDEAERVYTGGFKDGEILDDVVKIKVSPDIAACNAVYPSQSEIILSNALDMAMNMILGKKSLGGDIRAVFSEDFRIMDGHHRWAGSWLAGGGDTTIGGVQVMMPGKKLVRVLAAAGDYFHQGRRNDANAQQNIFKSNADDVKKHMELLTTKGDIYITAEEATKACELLAGSIKGATKLFTRRLSELQRNKPPSWAVKREKMPVISGSKGEHTKVAQDIEKGQLDIFKPYMEGL